MNQYVLEIVTEEQRAVQGFRRVEMSAKDLDGAMQRLSGGAVGLNKAFQAVDTSTKRYVGSTHVLNTLGVQTTSQLRAEIAVYDRLIQQHRNDAVAVAQLTAQKQRLNAQFTGFYGTASRSQQTLFSLGYIVNDLQQATYGWGAAIRATSNNLQPLLMGLGTGAGLAKWIPWVSLALSVATTAFVLFGDSMGEEKGAAKDAKDLAARLQGIADQMYRIKGEMPVKVFNTVEEAKAEREELEKQAEALERQLKARKEIGQTPVFSKTGQLSFVSKYGPVLTGDERTRAERDLAEAEAKIKALEEQITARETAERMAGTHGDKPKEQKKYVSLLEQEIERPRELQLQVKELANQGIAQYTRLQLQNEELVRQLALTKAIERAMQAPRFRLEALDPDFKRQIEADRQLRDRRLNPLTQSDRELTREAWDRIQQRMNEYAAMLEEKFGPRQHRKFEKYFDLSDPIKQGMANSVVALAEGTASFRGVLGSFMTDLGQSLVAQGFAGLAIKAFVKNPVVAIGAGAALIALGSRLRASSQAKADSFGSAGGVGGGGRYSGANYDGFTRRTSYNDSNPYMPNAYGGSGQAHIASVERMDKAANTFERAVDRLQQKGIPAHTTREGFRKAQSMSTYMHELTGVG